METSVFGGARIVPVARIEDPGRAVPAADALVAGGIDVIEITFRTDQAAAAIAACRAWGGIRVGAGTVRTVEQVDRAVDAGASFLVTPALAVSVVERARAHGIPIVPGVMTPTEIETAAALGLRELKFFPAAVAGGAAFLSAMAPVFPEMRFVPTGGVNATSVGEYLALPNVSACGGSWMIKPDWVAGGDYRRIRETTAAAVAALSSPR